MKISVEPKDDSFVIHVNEAIDLYSAPELKEAFRQGRSEGYYHYIVDLDNVDDLDSSALGALLFGAAVARSGGGRMFCINTGRRVQKILQTGRFDRLFSFGN